MRHSAAGPSSTNKPTGDPAKQATPAGFAKGPDGKWIKTGGPASSDDAAHKAAPGAKSSPQHFTPMEGGSGVVKSPSAGSVKSPPTASPAVKSPSTASPKIGSPALSRAGEEFANAGANDGLEIWRIEKLRPVPVDKAQYGKFYSGDSYIVLNTYTGKTGRKYDAHFWLGSSTSQDEAGVAAYKTVELDDKLGGKPVQHREVEQHESNLFLSYFKGGIQYMEGGIESGFKHVDRNAFTKRLLQLKGRRNVRVKEVPVSYKSLNNGDVFVLDAGLTLYQFNGAEASKMEKAKGLEVTANINSNERGARAKIHLIDYPADNNKPEIKKFWEELGGEGPVASAAEGGDDQAFEAAAAATVQLFRVSDASGQLEVTPVGTAPLKKQQLDTKDCFIVDVGSQIFVWVGKGSTQEEKSSSMQFATGYLEANSRPNHTPITRVVEGGEPPNFKSQFSAWSDVSDPASRPRLEKKVAGAQSQSKIDVNALHTSTRSLDTSSTKIIKHRGNGTLTVWRVENFKLADIPKEEYGLFFAGDSYVVQYSEPRPGGDDLHYLYFWQGRTSSTDEKGASAYLAKEKDDQLNGKAVQVRVVQNKEPDHFLALFNGALIVKQGGHPSGFTSISNVVAASADSPVQLYHIKGASEFTTRAIEVPAASGSLNSGDAFVLLEQEGTTIWFGSGCSMDERKLAKTVASRLSGGKSITEANEGSEPESFWNALGGKGDYASASAQEGAKDARLFWGSNASGVFKMEEIFDFTQDDLDEDDVYILDCFNEVYVWVGSGANEVEKKMALETAVDFVQKAPDSRSPDTPITRINAGAEPPIFTANFVAWDAEERDVYKRKMRQLLHDQDANAKTPVSARAALADMTAKDTYPYSELIASPKPRGVDTNNLEKYLSEDEFQKVLGVTRAAFDAMPGWKKSDLKKSKKLF